MAPTLEDLRAAAQRIAPHVHRTPVLSSRTIDDELGASVFFKCENLQKVGAFKARGATNAVLSLDEERAGHGVATHSSGNHGAALAYAAGVRGIPCHVVMPEDTPPLKVAAVRGYGAEVVFCTRAEREQVCKRVLRETGAALIHPYEEPAVVAGQGTAALELIEQTGTLDLVVAPVGGGGLMSGTTIAVAGLLPQCELRGAEPETMDDAARSLQSGVLQPGPAPASMADGLLTGLGKLAFGVLRANGVRIVTVSEAEIARATWTLVSRMKLVVEPSGATVLAALRAMGDDVRGKRVGAILSGGNTDFGWLGHPGLQAT